MATYNVEELLSMAAALYDGIVAKQVLRTRHHELSPEEQEKVLRNAAVRRLKFVPKQHTEGTRAQKLITSIGGYCRSRTFLPNAPYAPGVTGVRLRSRSWRSSRDGPNRLENTAIFLSGFCRNALQRTCLFSDPAAPLPHATPGRSCTSIGRCAHASVCLCRWAVGRT